MEIQNLEANPAKVYLAGGMRTNWQEDVKKECPELAFFDPSSRPPFNTLSEYGTWDLHHVKHADIIFVYMENTNPSGIGAAVEMGYAKGLGKTVILVLEPGNNHVEDRYLRFMTKVADITFTEFYEGLSHLQTYQP